LYRYSSIRSTNVTEEIKKAISTKEEEVSRAITSTNRQLAEVETSLRELHLRSASEEESRNAEDMTNTVEQIEEERNALNSSRKLLEELLSRTKEESIVKAVSAIQSRSTHIYFGNQGQGIQIGINNAAISGFHF
jgi:DNA-binding transcriptional regulator GbsR (MarR family)